MRGDEAREAGVAMERTRSVTASRLHRRFVPFCQLSSATHCAPLSPPLARRRTATAMADNGESKVGGKTQMQLKISMQDGTITVIKVRARVLLGS